MHLIEIEDLALPELQIYRTLRGNAFDADNSFIADSPKVVTMLLESDIVVHSILATRDYYAQHRKTIEFREISQCFVGEKKLLERIVGHKLHHGVMLHGRRPAHIPLEQMGERIIMLDTLSNMENVGAIARSAAALGVDSMMLPVASPHPYGRRAIRVSMGYVTRLRIHRFDTIIESVLRLKALGYTIYGAEASEDAIPLSKLDTVADKWVIIVGNEEAGLSRELLTLCDHVVQIEMAEGIKSFNVSTAASIVMHWLVIHRGKR
jgi:tRNA G18 (ribose-2'-O)-methylase SpoU